MACEIIDEHTPLTKQTIIHWDSWYTCKEVVKHCKDKGYRWIGDIKSNRVVYYGGEKFALSDLYEQLRLEGRFVDVVVEGRSI